MNFYETTGNKCAMENKHDRTRRFQEKTSCCGFEKIK